MIENERYKTELMLSDIRDNSLTGMFNNRVKEKFTLVSTLYAIVFLIFLIYVFPTVTSLLNIKGFFGKLLFLLVLFGVSFYIVIEEFVFERKKKDRRKVEVIRKGGDMVNYFMKIKDFVKKDYDLPYLITVIESSSHGIVPVEVTYHRYEDYSRLLDSISLNNITTQEFELKGRLTLFDKYRSLYSRFEGTTLIKFQESIFRENERAYRVSTSRRLYMLLYIPYSKDFQDILASIITSSYCKMQFLDEKMYKDMVESYFHCPVNLERMKAQNIIRNISLEETKLIEKFNNEEEVKRFLAVYKSTRYKNSYKFQLKGGGK